MIAVSSIFKSDIQVLKEICHAPIKLTAVSFTFSCASRFSEILSILFSHCIPKIWQIFSLSVIASFKSKSGGGGERERAGALVM